MGAWVVLCRVEEEERALGQVVDATRDAAEATAHAFFARILPVGASLRVIPARDAQAAQRHSASNVTLLPVLESLLP